MKKYFVFVLSILLLIFPITGKTATKNKAISSAEYYYQGVQLYQVGKYDLALEAFIIKP